MLEPKKINIYEDERGLEISFAWRAPIAYFMAFFALIWNTFLVFWYTIAIGTGAPFVFILFPLLHVAVGVYLAYHTLSLFLNQTFVDVTRDYLLVSHRPLHWWWGNTSIPLDEIEQLYVKEKKTQSSKGGGLSNYELRVRMKDFKDEKLISINGLSKYKLREIEAHLENYIGINDNAVEGEFNFGKARRPPVREEMAPPKDLIASPLGAVHDAEVNDYIHLNDETFRVLNVAKYDWKDGNSDRLLQLIDGGGEEKMLLIEQNKALIKAYQESKMTLLEGSAIDFDPQAPAKSFVVEGQLFTLYQHKVGDYFFDLEEAANEAQQWTYLSTDSQHQIRITSYEDMLTYYRGIRLKPEAFSNHLDLQQVPPKALNYRQNKWRDEDLV
ncbi:MAG: DUF4178 domain-containing protein [Bacteroidota bacterium]